jgi:hypothetical protein
MAETKPPREERADRKLPVLKIQKAMATITVRITKSETEPQAESKLTAKELVSLSNSLAGLGRLLKAVDTETAEAARKKTKSGAFLD